MNVYDDVMDEKRWYLNFTASEFGKRAKKLIRYRNEVQFPKGSAVNPLTFVSQFQVSKTCLAFSNFIANVAIIVWAYA